MAAESLYFVLHDTLVDIKLSLLHLLCPLFIMLMRKPLASNLSPLLIGLKDPEPLLTPFCQATELQSQEI